MVIKVSKLTLGERMMKIETDLAYIKTSVEDLKKTIHEQMELENKRYETLDRKFAAKWVEKAAYSAAAVLLTLLASYAFKVITG
jgi:SMC interacting uncharacterized protein involved in chromosome segregation